MTTNFTIQLDEPALREATMQAVMGLLTPEHREKILKEAIGSILTVDTGTYGNKTSALQRAFNSAVETLAYQCARDVVANDLALKETLDELMRNAFEKILSRNWENKDFVTRIAEGVISSISRER